MAHYSHILSNAVDDYRIFSLNSDNVLRRS